jgi:hypothetical protein
MPDTILTIHEWLAELREIATKFPNDIATIKLFEEAKDHLLMPALLQADKVFYARIQMLRDFTDINPTIEVLFQIKIKID